MNVSGRVRLRRSKENPRPLWETGGRGSLGTKIEGLLGAKIRNRLGPAKERQGRGGAHSGHEG
jgi:hypothetical protein